MWARLNHAQRVGSMLLRRSYRRCWQAKKRRFATQEVPTRTSKDKGLAWHQNDHPFMVGRHWGGHSLSELAGNLSFVGVCIAYLNTDILMLRVLATGSIALSIVFQYYRAIPLWIPIRWNFLLLQINIMMMASLVLERSRADNMSKALETIYEEGLFHDRGFSKVEFLRLFEKAKVVKLKPGERLTENGKVNTKLYFVTEGTIQIERRRKRIAAVTPNHFIGEMTFLNYLCETCEDGDRSGRIATADAVVGTNVVAYAWDFDQLKEYLGGEREVRNALSAYMNHDLRAKLARLNVHHAARTKTMPENGDTPPKTKG